MNDRDQWRTTCERELGKPYIWGAEGPEAYDCSGFVQWGLRHLNLDPPGGQTAAGLFRFFSNNRSRPVTVAEADLGDVVFFGTNESVTHVGLAWGGSNMLEAGGGGRNTTSAEIARKQGAKVRIRPIERRKDLVAILRPLALKWSSLERGRNGRPAESMPRFGAYVGTPSQTDWLGDGRHMRLMSPLTYVDEGGRGWPVPPETVVDGASIPRVFWSLIGGPLEDGYRDASIVHDYYCNERSRPWLLTHRMFYDAMRCGGVSVAQAKVMYYAVYRFGPRWTNGLAAVADGFDRVRDGVDVPAAIPVEPFDAASFEIDATFIRTTDPDLATIETLADARAMKGDGPLSHAKDTLSEAIADQAVLTRIASEAAATWARLPLLEQLVALQDNAVTAANAEAAGSLLAQYSRQERHKAPEVSRAPSLEELRPRYEALYASCQIRPERVNTVAWYRRKLEQYRHRYEAVADKTGIPWWFIGVVHALEASFNFNGHLHNGDPLSARTVNVPKNRPKIWNPPNDWESSALDALTYERLTGLSDWSLAAALYRWESFNGFGYYKYNINSPYLWSFSNHYTKGKYVRDNVFDPEAVSKQCGAAVMLCALQNAGLVVID